MLQQTPSCTLAYAGDLKKFGRAVAHLAAFAMEGYGEAMGLVPNQLNQVQHGRVMIERDRIFLLSVNIENLLSLGDGRQRLVNDFERFQSLGRGVELAKSAIDQHQTR